MTKNVPNSCIYPYLRVLMILLLGIIPVLTPVSAVIFTEDGTNLTAIELYTMTNSTRTGEATSPVVLFTDPNCGSCSHVHEYMETYLKEHPDVSVEIANLSAGPENEDRVNQFYMNYHRDDLRVPVIFIGPVGLLGSDEIITNFATVYNWYTGSKA